MICEEDKTEVFKNFQNVIDKKGEFILDDVGKEIADEMRRLSPIKELQIEIENCFKGFFKEMIGIHIRKTDGGFVNYDWESIIKKLISQCQNWCNSNRGIFLATDDLEVYNSFANNLGKNLVFYNPPTILCGSTSSNKFNNDKYNVFCGAVDMNLLGKCNKMINGTVNSTFSICGMLLAEDNIKKYLISDEESIPMF